MNQEAAIHLAIFLVFVMGMLIGVVIGWAARAAGRE